ncbi:MAG TPA: protein kinase [Blastocatellia bacterium]|nr:protein kinase [Blastocatellia bacterium]
MEKPRPAGTQLEPGTLLNDRYYIVKRIGGGGMGSVYQARDKRLADRLCAVKEMIEMFADEGQRAKAVEDFTREAQLLASLEHRSIPTIFDYFIENGRYYLVMKYISGGDLAEQMRKRGGKVDELTVTRWGVQASDVLHYIHNQDPPIIYRDLKPANLMLDDKQGRVMLIDFGIARFVAPTQKGVTAIGTMGYAPPELFAGKVQPRSDLYSLGATMFHMLTGSDPQDNPLLIFDFSKNPRPSQINPALTPEMDAIIMKTVSHKPEDRPGSALELMRMLEDHERHLVNPQSPEFMPSLDGTIFCGNCGQRIASDDVFCAHCGSRQRQGAPGRPSARLMIIGSNDAAASFVLDKDSHLIGRTDPHTGIFPEVDLSLYDPETKVSRRHARIYRQGQQFLIEDLSSVNGTTINGAIRLPPKQPRVLNTGDELKLGETNLKFMLG